MTSKFFIWYLNLLYKTCEIDYDLDESVSNLDDSIIIFWHGQSFCAYYLMKLFPDAKVGVVMTSDARGEYIEDMTKSFGGIPVRIPNGAAARHGIREIIDMGKADEKLVFSFSVDGPLGPQYEPKKMVFHISNKTNKKVLCCKIDVKRKIQLKKRWDKYVIPLPFGKIHFKIKVLPPTAKEELTDFENYQKKIVNELI